jgi:hypothetical protein
MHYLCMTTLNKITEQNNFQERNFLNLLPRPFSTVRLEKFVVPTFELLYLWRSGREPHVWRVSHRYQVGHHSWPLLRRVRTIYYFLLVWISTLWLHGTVLYRGAIRFYSSLLLSKEPPPPPGCRTGIQTRDLTCGSQVRYDIPQWATSHPYDLRHIPVSYITPPWATWHLMSYAPPNELHHTPYEPSITPNKLRHTPMSHCHESYICDKKPQKLDQNRWNFSACILQWNMLHALQYAVHFWLITARVHLPLQVEGVCEDRGLKKIIVWCHS